MTLWNLERVSIVKMNSKKQREIENKFLEPYLPEFNHKLLFNLLQNRFPQWMSVDAIKQNIRNIHPEDLETLETQHFLEKRKVPMGEDENGKVQDENWFRLSPSGFSYLMSLATNDTNKWLLLLTIITLVIGLIQIGIGLIGVLI